MNSTDMLWMLICIFALLFMQVGFCCLEAGFVRSKNTINVVIKNSIDLALTLLVFLLLGYSLLMGPSLSGVIGDPAHHFLLEKSPSAENYILFLFFCLFAATTVTIISGASAERISFTGYLIFSILVGGLLFPTIGHWGWYEASSPEQHSGWLKRMGFIDFAGASIVHSVGGWAALAMILHLGPRTGRFKEPDVHILTGQPEPCPFTPENIPLIAVGTLLLWTAWLGFNGGSELGMTDRVPLIITNTLLSGAAGLAIVVPLSLLFNRKPDVLLMMNSGLGGLVASTAACHIMLPWQAVCLGMAAGCTYMLCSRLLEMIKLDDVVDAIPVHLGCGILGTLSVVFFVDTPSMHWAEILTVQLSGIIVIGISSFSVCWLFFLATEKFISYRVDRKSEEIGLNVSQHDARMPLTDTFIQISQHAIETGFRVPIPVPSDTDAGKIAHFYNALLEKLDSTKEEQERIRRTTTVHQQHDSISHCLERSSWIKNLVTAQFEHSQGKQFAVSMLDIDGFKTINQEFGSVIGDALLRHLGSTVDYLTGEDVVVGRLEKDQFALLFPDMNLKQVETLMERIVNNLNASPLYYSDIKVEFSVRSTTADPLPDEKPDQLLGRLLASLNKKKSAHSQQSSGSA